MGNDVRICPLEREGAGPADVVPLQVAWGPRSWDDDRRARLTRQGYDMAVECPQVNHRWESTISLLLQEAGQTDETRTCLGVAQGAFGRDQ